MGSAPLFASKWPLPSAPWPNPSGGVCPTPYPMRTFARWPVRRVWQARAQPQLRLRRARSAAVAPTPVASRRLPRPDNPQAGRRAVPAALFATLPAQSRSSLALGARQMVSLIVVLNNRQNYRHLSPSPVDPSSPLRRRGISVRRRLSLSQRNSRLFIHVRAPRPSQMVEFLSSDRKITLRPPVESGERIRIRLLFPSNDPAMQLG